MFHTATPLLSQHSTTQIVRLTENSNTIQPFKFPPNEDCQRNLLSEGMLPKLAHGPLQHLFTALHFVFLHAALILPKEGDWDPSTSKKFSSVTALMLQSTQDQTGREGSSQWKELSKAKKGRGIFTIISITEGELDSACSCPRYKCLSAKQFSR